MKKIDTKIFAFLVSGSLLLAIFAVQLYREKLSSQAELALSSSIQAYASEMIPLYKKKATLAEHILKRVGNQDSNVLGITAHIQNWRALVLSDISEMEELNTHLDTWLAPHVGTLEGLAKSDQGLRPLLQNIRAIDQSLADTRSRISPLIHGSVATQN